MPGNDVLLAFLYFFLYALVSFLGTAIVQAIEERRALKTFVFGFVQTMILLSVLSKVLVDPKPIWFVVVALGDASGGALAVLWPKCRKKQQK